MYVINSTNLVQRQIFRAIGLLHQRNNFTDKVNLFNHKSNVVLHNTFLHTGKCMQGFYTMSTDQAFVLKGKLSAFSWELESKSAGAQDPLIFQIVYRIPLIFNAVHN